MSTLNWNSFTKLKWRRQALLVFVAAFVVRFGYLCVAGQLTQAPRAYSEPVRIARYVAHGTGFVSPVGPERDDPSSWYAPGYIAALAVIYRVLGEDTVAALVVARVLGLLALSGAISIWVIIGRHLLGRRAAALAAVLMILSPAITSVGFHLWDTFPSMLGSALCLGIFAFAPLDRWWRQMLAGAACGVVALINPCFTTSYPVWFLWNWGVRCRGGWGSRRLIRGVVCLLVGFTVIILPWTIRNRLVFGEWFYIRANFGFELWVGNAPWSNGSLVSVDGRRVHPVFDPAEEARLVKSGEFSYFRDCAAQAKSWFVHDPARVLRNTVRRIRWFWLGQFDNRCSITHNVLKFIGFSVPGVLGLMGALYVLLCRRRAWVLVATMAVFPLPYYLTLTMVRYRIPIEPLVLLLTAVVLAEVLPRNYPWRVR